MDALRVWGDVLDFTFYKKINVIGGTDGFGLNSGAHKTHLFNALQDGFQNGIEFCNYRMIFLAGLFEKEILDINEPVVYVVDEMNIDIKKNEMIFRSVEKTNKYLLAIGRLFIPQLQHSIDSIFTITSADHKFGLKNSIGFSTRNRVNEIYTGFVEDNEKTALFYNRVLRGVNANVIVTPTGGKDKIPRLVWAVNGLSKVFLIVDNPKFGSILMRIIERLDSGNVSDILIFAPDCFEEVLLGFFKSDLIERFVMKGIPIDDVDDSEYICEHEIKKYLPIYSKKSQVKFWDWFYDSTLVNKIDFNPIVQVLKDMFVGDSAFPACERWICFELNKNKIEEIKNSLKSYKEFDVLGGKRCVDDQ